MSALPLAARLGAIGRETVRAARRVTALERWPGGRTLGDTDAFAVPAAFYEPDQLDRVTACGFGTSLEAQRAALDATHWQAAPPVATTFGDAVCFGGRIYSGGRVHHAGGERPYRHFVAPGQSFDAAVITNSVAGLRYFGHWLRDDCAAREIPLADFGRPISLVRPDWPDCGFYESLFDQTWDEIPAFFARRLTAITDIGFSPDKARRLRTLRERVRERLPAPPNAGGIVYIRRGPSGAARRLVNEEALLDRLTGAGVAVVEAEAGTEAMAGAILEASMVVSVEGSQIAHAVFGLADQGAVLTLQPPDRFYNPHREWTGLLGMDYGIVVGETAAGGFTVAPNEVLAMIARMRP